MTALNRFVVVDQTGECYAVCDTRAAALVAAQVAENSLDDAEACGHPASAAWVRARRPIVVRLVPEDVAAGYGVPLLDREP